MRNRLPNFVAELAEAVQNAAIELSNPTFGHEVLTIDEFLGAIEPARN